MYPQNRTHVFKMHKAILEVNINNNGILIYVRRLGLACFPCFVRLFQRDRDSFVSRHPYALDR